MPGTPRMVNCTEFFGDPPCTNSFRDTGKWTRIKASAEGWFFTRPPDDKAYCPDHVPDWVPAWRDSKNREELTVAERVEARHQLKAAIESIDLLRNSLDPNHGMETVRRGQLGAALRQSEGRLSDLRQAMAPWTEGGNGGQ